MFNRTLSICRDPASRRLGFLVLLAIPVFAGASTFDVDVDRASNVLDVVMPAFSEQMKWGNLAAASEQLLAAFPEATRNAAESFLLGNVLFEVDRKQSYALHRAAAEAEPLTAAVLLEWSLEQHRQGQYAGALASYQQFSQAQPGFAASYVLQADCLLRLNRVDEAMEAWRRSETAPDGTVEKMENLVCAVHREPAPHQRRAELLARATQQLDVDAAEDLIALDCDFPLDWWHGGPFEPYLSHDAPVVAALLKLPPDEARGRAMACAVECASAKKDIAGEIKRILTERRMLVDTQQTIPEHAGLLAVILTAAVQARAIDDATLRERIGPKLVDRARNSRDARLWSLALFAGPTGTPHAQLQLGRDGWQATGDARLAAGVLFLKWELGQLAGDDADLAAALRQFPDSGLVQRAAFEIARREQKIARTLLADAARAEFKHFTSFVAPVTSVTRPRSDYLREYFAQMRLVPER